MALLILELGIVIYYTAAAVPGVMIQCYVSIQNLGVLFMHYTTNFDCIKSLKWTWTNLDYSNSVPDNIFPDFASFGSPAVACVACAVACSFVAPWIVGTDKTQNCLSLVCFGIHFWLTRIQH